MPTIRPRRSVLYVPASNPRAMEKAAGLGADVVVLDLEDAVAPAEKPAARARAAAWLSANQPPAVRPEIVVRINALDTPWGADDIAAVLPAPPSALMLPKVGGAAAIEAVRARLRAAPAGLALWAMIETPRAVLEPLAIAAAASGHPPVEVLVLGLNDLARETRTRQVAGRAPMLPWMMSVIAAARTFGLDVVDGVFNDIGDAPGFAAECAAARDCGFDGKTVIHPAQIAPCNAAFSPDAAEIAEAEALVELFERPENAGVGVLAFKGRMVERLHAEMARRTLALARATKAQERGSRSGPVDEASLR